MSESIIVTGTTRKEKYISLLPQIQSLAKDNPGALAVLGNIMSALKYGMDFYWVGLYFVKNNELILGPFQGTVACTRIAFGKGVCGYAWEHKKTVIVPNVNDFEGHIACSSVTQSEIVLPVFDKKGKVIMVLDIDSEHLSHFSDTDEIYLKQVVALIEKTVENYTEASLW
jgi:L-methionine (R)-S-oxide reductase